MIIFLLLFWTILSGQSSTFFVVSAFLCLSITIIFDKKLFKISPILIGFNPNWLHYAWKLLKEMYLSSLMMLNIIWFKKGDIKPVWGIIDAQAKDTNIQVLQANSITLTPGTMSIDLKDNKILVHAISDEAMKELFTVPELKK